MAILSHDRKESYKVKYCIQLRDNTRVFKIKFFKSKARAMLVLREIERLEQLSEQKKLNVRDLAYFVYKKLISPEDARALTKERVYHFSPFEATVDWERSLGI